MDHSTVTLRVVDAALVVVDAVAGVEGQTEKVWTVAEEYGVARLVVVNRMDRENASFERGHKRGLIDYRAACGVQQPGSWFHPS